MSDATDRQRAEWATNVESWKASNMTKREAFAMAAMQGLSMRVTSLFDHEVAADAVRLADATLRELTKAAP